MIKVIIEKYKDKDLIIFNNKYKNEMNKISNYAWNILYEELKTFNIDLRKEQIYFNQNNKPYINKNIFFNISHSKDLIALAISNCEIGIDIEYINRFNNIEEAILWTKKESIIKLKGESLNKIKSLDETKYKINTIQTKEYVLSVINSLEEDIGELIC